MTRSVEIPEAAVDYLGRLWWKQYDTESPYQHAQSVAKTREAIEGLLPYLAPAEHPVLDRAAARRAIYTALFGSPEGTYDNVEVALDAVTALSRTEAEVKAEALREAAGAPAGDGGLREALEKLAIERKSDDGNDLIVFPAELSALLAAHPAAPAVPQPVDREALRDLLSDFVDSDDCWYDHHGYCQAHGWFRTDPACPHARAKAVLAGEQVEP